MPEQSEVRDWHSRPRLRRHRPPANRSGSRIFGASRKLSCSSIPRTTRRPAPREACSFRDHYEAFREAGAEVIGISSDSGTSHQRFARLWKLPFFLVSDSKGEIRARYGVGRTLGLFPGRVTYLIDREGIIRHIFSSQLQPGRHVTEMLQALRTMRASPGSRGEVGSTP